MMKYYILDCRSLKIILALQFYSRGVVDVRLMSIIQPPFYTILQTMYTYTARLLEEAKPQPSFPEFSSQVSELEEHRSNDREGDQIPDH